MTQEQVKSRFRPRKAYEIDSSVSSSFLGYKDEDAMFLYMANCLRKMKNDNPAKYRQFLEIIKED